MGNTLSTDSPLSRGSLAAALSLTGYLVYKSMKPPRPVRLATSKDAAKYHPAVLNSAFTILAGYRTLILGTALLNAAAAALGAEAFASLTQRIAPYATHINPAFMTWNTLSALALPLIAGTAALRLQAMGELGVNFTFDLHDPNALITSGLYAYVQHPSYTTAFVSFVGGTAWFMRADGALGAFLPPGVFAAAQRWAPAFYPGVAAFLILGMGRRVADEEAMLKAKFGDEWVAWHRRTARFVPFLF